MDLRKLSYEFPRDAVSWRVQGKPYKITKDPTYQALALAYIDARDVMDRLDEVCGAAGWQDKYDVLSSGLYVCHIGIHTENGWVWKTDGAGETAVEGKKGGMSDAFKRCGVKWGIGRYLYRLDSPWVPCDVRETQKGTAWKSWSVDPWTKVKTASYVKAEAEREQSEEDLRNKSIAAAIYAMHSSSDIDALKDTFKSLEFELKSHPDVIAAKDARKAELTNIKEAA